VAIKFSVKVMKSCCLEEISKSVIRSSEKWGSMI
jgi:hypothetical protein